ncbi:hypothetical protein [Clostridium sp. DJ247]|uniref:hypothetical protein n=1 Tax=Clostridium sp. DJ247 TaxID=2726188 RepID=UPI001624990F|nr:hypothetical protein [Clostridium sp. DJ247]MBC2580839.1 hypothetical protein [Clostridium sp. DJ247]
MKLTSLKRQDIRRVFKYEGEEIIVYNPNDTKQELIRDFIARHTNPEDKSVEIADIEVLGFLFPLLTNLEMPTTKEELEEVLIDPNFILTEIGLELRDIVAEIAKTTIHTLKGNLDLLQYANLTEADLVNLVKGKK